MKTKEEPKVRLNFVVPNHDFFHYMDCETKSFTFRIISDIHGDDATLILKFPLSKDIKAPLRYEEHFDSVDQAEERANELANQLFQDLNQFVK